MFPDFLNTLPAEWKVLPVSEACAFTAKPRSLDFGKYQELAFVPMDLIPTGRLHFSNFILKSPSEVTSGTYFEEGDLLVSKITPCFENGKQGIAHAIPNGFGIATTEVIPLKPRDGLTHLPFIAYYLLHHEVRHLIAAAMEGATGRQRLPKDLLAQWPVPIPPIDEQRAIARLLETIQTAAQVEAAICDKLAALKSATMAKLFREGLRGEPLKQTEIGEIPESWEVKPVSAVSDAVSGGTPSKQRTDWWSGSIPWASPKDMKRLRLRDTEDHITPEAAEAGSRIVPPKTVFIVVRGMVLAKDVPVAITEVPMAFNQDMKALLPSERINPDFLLYALCARKSALIQEIGTSAHGTRRMAGSSVDGLLIPVPKDSEEQRDIAETLHMLDRREEISKERVRCLQALFSSTLHALMTGAIRVKDLDLAEVSDA
ncbi:MAG: type I restriction-modification enzyme, S subunit [Nitrospiraceae bacterium]|nr:MAG: type I restriction-modification enzyme, S subunit [Nitrospiraceae bacterium]